MRWLVLLIVITGVYQFPCPARNLKERPEETLKFAVDSVWQEVENTSEKSATADPRIFRLFRLNKNRMAEILSGTVLESIVDDQRHGTTLSLPMPDGREKFFSVVESPVMDQILCKKYPGIKSYRGQGLADPTATVRFTWTRTKGLFGMVLSDTGTIYITPSGSADEHLVYNKSDTGGPGDSVKCLWRIDDSISLSSLVPTGPLEGISPQVTNGGVLRTYRLAVAATGEFSNTYRFPGDTDEDVRTHTMIIINAIVNSLNNIYEHELSMRFILVGGKSSLIYTNGATDPYTNGDSSAMLAENQNNLDDPAVLGSGNYDIGHVLGNGGGGRAKLRVTCWDGLKAYGNSGADPADVPLMVDYMTHEVAHQFGANHTFNGTTGICNEQRSGNSAFEPGSGSTIMGYPGFCGGQSLQIRHDDYFHIKSLEEIVSYVTNSDTCSIHTNTGNTPPIADAGAIFTIPRNTAFSLTAAGGDADGDPLTYSWEQYNLGDPSPPDTDQDGRDTRPIFRSFPPDESPVRTFPRFGNELTANLTIQQNSTDAIDSIPRGTAVQLLGSGLSGTFSKMEIKYEANGNQFYYYSLMIMQFDDGTYDRAREVEYFPVNPKKIGRLGIITDVWDASDYNGPIVFDPSKFYAVMYYQLDARPIGNSVDSYPPGCYAATWKGQFFQCNPSNVQDVYFKLFTGTPTASYGESLPSRSRTMTFQVTVRDNRSGGGAVSSALTSIIVDGSIPPFSVFYPDSPVTWNGGTTQTVTWNNGNTVAHAFIAENVRILFSADGGNSYPFILKNSTPNDGTEPVTVPNISTSMGRIKIEAINNIYFDISDNNINVITPTAASADLAGQILLPDGRVLRGASVTLLGRNISAPLSTRTNAKGHYRFNSLPVGETYFITPRLRGYDFVPQNRLVNHGDEQEQVNFTAYRR